MINEKLPYTKRNPKCTVMCWCDTLATWKDQQCAQKPA